MVDKDMEQDLLELKKDIENVKKYVSTESNMMIEVMVRLSALESLITGPGGICNADRLRDEIDSKFSQLYDNIKENWGEDSSQLSLPLGDIDGTNKEG